MLTCNIFRGQKGTGALLHGQTFNGGKWWQKKLNTLNMLILAERYNNVSVVGLIINVKKEG